MTTPQQTPTGKPGEPKADRALATTKVLEERQELKKMAMADDVTKVFVDPTQTGELFKLREKGTTGDRKLFEYAALFALVSHFALVHLVIPEFSQRTFVEGEKKVIKVVRMPLQAPPPKEPKKVIEKIEKPKIKPVPDPTPEEPEQIMEQEPEPEFEIPDDVEVVFGEPEGPPLPTGPQRLTANMVRPTLITRVEPEYPPLARKAGLEGVVILEAIINTEGIVEDVQVLRSMGKTGMDEAAIAAVKQWVFTPAKSSTGAAIPVYLTLTVQFTIR